MKRIFSRGLNYHGQCGLGKEMVHSMEKFTELDTKLPITKIYTNLANTFALDEDGRTVYYWGFNWDIRSFFRTAVLLNSAPRFMYMMKYIWPPLKSFPCSPTILNKFNNKIIDIHVGGGHCLFLDEIGFAYTIGENSCGQSGTSDLNPLYIPFKINFMKDYDFIKISAGFQHSLFLTNTGEVYGCGKSDKYQLGEDYLKCFNEAKTFKDIGMGIKKLNLFDIYEKIIDISAGKYHSAFLTDSGNVYLIGVNRFGQMGQSNLNLHTASSPIKLEFPSEVRIVKMECGDNHNLMLADDGGLWANGDNSAGQVDGNLDKFLYYYCSPQLVELPDKSKVKKIYAKNNRSAVMLENGNFYYWGGYSYHNEYPLNNQPKYEGFNLFNVEPGIPKDGKIVDVALGLFHDIVIME